MRDFDSESSTRNPSGKFVLGALLAVLLLVVGGVVALVYAVSVWGKHTQGEAHVAQNQQVVEVIKTEGNRTFYEATEDGSSRVLADVSIAFGNVETAHAEDGALFQAEVGLANHTIRPHFKHERDGRTARVSLGLENEEVSISGLNASSAGNWQLYFSRDHPLELNLSLGAADAVIDMTGIPLERFELSSGMASTILRFDEPNTSLLRRIDIESGLSEFRAEGLGNARFEYLAFEGGAGSFYLDFTGEEIVPGAIAEIEVGMASLEVIIPGGRSVHVVAPRSFMTSVNMPSSLRRVGRERWISPGSENDPNALLIKIESGPGSVNVREQD